MEHARLSASGSKKWLNCPASLGLEENFPNTSSEYARLGTTAHALAEHRLKQFLGESVNNTEEDILKDLTDEDKNEMLTLIEEFVNYVIAKHAYYRREKGNAELTIEQRLDYSSYAPDGFGTGDVVLKGGATLEIIDLKYGKGIKVDAHENSQLKLYALGALEHYFINRLEPIEEVVLTVYQPRLNSIESFRTTPNNIFKWGETVVKPSAKKALEGGGACVYGTHCDDGFCKARTICAEYNKHYLSLQEYIAKSPKFDGGKLTDDELIKAYELSIGIEKWVKDLRAYITENMLSGKTYNGYKLIEGSGRRRFKDEDAVIKALQKAKLRKDKYITTKLKSLTELEKLLGAEKFDRLLGELIEKTAGSPTIVKDSDPRPAIDKTKQATEDFKGLLELI